MSVGIYICICMYVYAHIYTFTHDNHILDRNTRTSGTLKNLNTQNKRVAAIIVMLCRTRLASLRTATRRAKGMIPGATTIVQAYCHPKLRGTSYCSYKGLTTTQEGHLHRHPVGPPRQGAALPGTHLAGRERERPDVWHPKVLGTPRPGVPEVAGGPPPACDQGRLTRAPRALLAYAT